MLSNQMQFINLALHKILTFPGESYLESQKLTRRRFIKFDGSILPNLGYLSMSCVKYNICLTLLPSGDVRSGLKDNG
ncbi:hypothetical protein RCL_jg17944.t1 [Rhizophagus clarus]|uniref:Uncharacterized protein n=1 Tax=Rhizophagus clarus TaxID=94130 RepID=A0A8H3L430_9GLOM|nr:hypothetical protein RCL_jg17944.t1 [Rhizophagus clarus]